MKNVFVVYDETWCLFRNWTERASEKIKFYNGEGVVTDYSEGNIVTRAPLSENVDETDPETQHICRRARQTIYCNSIVDFFNKICIAIYFEI